MQTGISCIALAGIVVNNNIVLIDTFNVLKKNNPDFSLREAEYLIRPKMKRSPRWDDLPFSISI